MSLTPPTMILAGGGTGGHVFPALAIAAELEKRRPDARIVFAGTRKRIEGRIVPKHGYEFVPIWIGGFQRRAHLQNLLFPAKVLVSLFQSFFLIWRFKPSAVIGTGGYVCGPVLAAASLLGIPVFIHESNSYPGLTTRILASRATRVFLGSGDARKWMKPGTVCEVVGTPTMDPPEHISRSEALAHFGLDDSKPVILITGGSQGAASINNAVLKSIVQIGSSAQLIWQTGSRQLEEIQQALAGNFPGWVGAFIDRMDLAYAAANVVLCRAGATTIAEITRVGKPAILVPYPFAAGDHQTHNARSLVDSGAAILIPDGELPARLEQELLTLLGDQDRRIRMAAAARQLGRPDAGRIIAGRIIEIITGP